LSAQAVITLDIDWAILNGEDRIGLCIKRMVGSELDSGDIIARDYVAIEHSTKVWQVWE
jgi:methionyl-tRNA formyltransferase